MKKPVLTTGGSTAAETFAALAAQAANDYETLATTTPAAVAKTLKAAGSAAVSRRGDALVLPSSMPSTPKWRLG